MAIVGAANAGAFSTLGPMLSPSLLSALELMGMEQMTPVQAATIPQLLSNKDVAVEAVTGTGKTLAYAIPVLELLLREHTSLPHPHLSAVVLLPTRELAAQVAEVFNALLAEITTVEILLCVGGINMSEEMAKLTAEKDGVLVGTPGRVRAILESIGKGKLSTVSLKHIAVLVLDEADRLLDLGFETAINAILALLPKQRRTGLFSATQTQDVEKIVRAGGVILGLRNPVRIAVKVEQRRKGNSVTIATPSSLCNFSLVIPYKSKLDQLVAFLEAHCEEKMIVYFATCASVDYHHSALSRLAETSKLPLLALHGKMVPKRRTLTYKRFTEMTGGIMFCTDIAARGLDIPCVDWVIQYDPPLDPAAFVHRCGRTARLGREGKALVFISPQEESYIDFMALRKVPLQPMKALPTTTDTFEAVRRLAVQDRALYEKGIIAFVSFVRAYKEHRCHLIFQLKELDIGGVARAFCLVNLPKVSELRGVEVDFQPMEIDLDSIPYKDQEREKQRQAGRRSQRDRQEKRKAKIQSEPWSLKKKRKAKQLKAREIKAKKRSFKENAMLSLAESGAAEERQKDIDDDVKELNSDWLELQAEKRQKKKQKQGSSGENFASLIGSRS